MGVFRRYKEQKAQAAPTNAAGNYTFTDGELGIAPGQEEFSRATAADSERQTERLLGEAAERQGAGAAPLAQRTRQQGSGNRGSAGGSVRGSAFRVENGDAVGSLARLLGPSPEEVAAEEAQARQQKAKMQGWAGLFNGLRHLGNLYYATRGATPQQYRTDPTATIEQNYQAERERLARQRQAQRQYYTDLWNLQRQAEGDRRKDELHKAQVDYYGTRDEMARMRAENDRLKAEAQARQTEARTKNIETRTRQLEELHPLQKRRLEAVIKKTQHDANRPYSTGRSGGRGGSGSDPYVELATLLNDQPEVIGPILQQEGLGVYNGDTREFTFSKNAPKGMVTTANRRARAQGAAPVAQRTRQQGSGAGGGKGTGTKPKLRKNTMGL